MAILKVQNKNLTELKTKTFSTELELQTLVDENLNKIFGLEFIRREFGGQGLSIDTIAYDPQTKAPVLIEYKKESYQSVIDQGMAYLNWLLSHKGDYWVALQEKLGKREVDWSQPRVIFIARSFNVHQIYASGFKNAPFKLFKYDLCDDIFLLEPVETPKSDVTITSVFGKLQKGVFALDERIWEKPVSWYIGYKVRYYNFCAFILREHYGSWQIKVI